MFNYFSLVIMEETINVFRLLRIARDIKVKDLAEKLCVTPAYINAIEKGQRMPSDRVIRDYAEALGVEEQIIRNFSVDYKDSSFEKTMLKVLKILCGEK